MDVHDGVEEHLDHSFAVLVELLLDIVDLFGNLAHLFVYLCLISLQLVAMNADGLGGVHIVMNSYLPLRSRFAAQCRTFASPS